MNSTIPSVTINKNIHLPASFYFCSGYIFDLSKEILGIINNYEKNSIFIKSVDMNDNTYNWLFRLFSSITDESPLSSTPTTKYIYDYSINITSNTTLPDGAIKFNIGE